MTQFRSYTFESPLNAFDDNSRLLGMIAPGRHRGLDTFTSTGGLNFTISHAGTGIEKTLENLTQTPNRSVVMTPQGMVVEEDAAIALSIASNGANAFQRIDLVIMEHEFLAAAGGQAATYSVLQGPDGLPLDITALPNPEKQVIIGRLYVPASDTDAVDVVYIPNVPLKGFPQVDHRAEFKGSVGAGTSTSATYDATTQRLEVGDVGHIDISTLGGSKDVKKLSFKSGADHLPTNGSLITIVATDQITYKQFPTGAFMIPTGADLVVPAGTSVTWRIYGAGLLARYVSHGELVNEVEATMAQQTTNTADIAVLQNDKLKGFTEVLENASVTTSETEISKFTPSASKASTLMTFSFNCKFAMPSVDTTSHLLTVKLYVGGVLKKTMDHTLLHNGEHHNFTLLWMGPYVANDEVKITGQMTTFTAAPVQNILMVDANDAV